MPGVTDTFRKVKPQGGIYGFGWGRCAGIPPGIPSPQHPTHLLCTLKENKFWKELFHFSIIDLVQIPADLPPGDYVLGFRWDCEQTPQIWQNCADVTITA